MMKFHFHNSSSFFTLWNLRARVIVFQNSKFKPALQHLSAIIHLMIATVLCEIRLFYSVYMGKYQPKYKVDLTNICLYEYWIKWWWVCKSDHTGKLWLFFLCIWAHSFWFSGGQLYSFVSLSHLSMLFLQLLMRTTRCQTDTCILTTLPR